MRRVSFLRKGLSLGYVGKNQSPRTYRDTSLTRNRLLLGIYSRPVPRALHWSWEGGAASPLLFNSALFLILVPLEECWRREHRGLFGKPRKAPTIDHPKMWNRTTLSNTPRSRRPPVTW